MSVKHSKSCKNPKELSNALKNLSRKERIEKRMHTLQKQTKHRDLYPKDMKQAWKDTKILKRRQKAIDNANSQFLINFSLFLKRSPKYLAKRKKMYKKIDKFYARVDSTHRETITDVYQDMKKEEKIREKRLEKQPNKIKKTKDSLKPALRKKVEEELHQDLDTKKSDALEENSDGPPDDMPEVASIMKSAKFEALPTKKQKKSSEQALEGSSDGLPDDIPEVASIMKSANFEALPTKQKSKARCSFQGQPIKSSEQASLEIETETAEQVGVSNDNQDKKIEEKKIEAADKDELSNDNQDKEIEENKIGTVEEAVLSNDKQDKEIEENKTETSEEAYLSLLNSSLGFQLYKALSRVP